MYTVIDSSLNFYNNIECEFSCFREKTFYCEQNVI